MKALQVIQSAYRCTVEEQDDPAVWISHAMTGAGAELGVLLRGNAVNYAVEGQDATGLSLGGKVQTQPPRLDRDVAALASKGVAVHAVTEDAEERGIDPSSFVPGVKPIAKADLAGLYAEYDQIWSW